MIHLKAFLVETISCLFILFATYSHGQNSSDWQYSIQKFSTQHGLPSLEVYFVHEDIRGYLWIGTDHGLVRFNGYEFTVFTEKDGLADNTVFLLMEDSKGGFWLVCKDRKLVYYDHKTFKKYIANEDNIMHKKAYYFDIFNDTLYCSNHDLTKYYSISLPDKIKRNKWIGKSDAPLGNYAIIDIDNKSLIYKTNNNSDSNWESQNTTSSAYWINLKNKYEKVLKIDDTYRLLVYNNSRLKLGAAKLLLLKKDSVVYEKKMWQSNNGAYITTLFNAGNGMINISTNSGVYVFDAIRGQVKDHLFPGEFITSSLWDKEGNLWVSSRDNGVWFLKSDHIRTIRPNAVEGKNKITRIRIVDNTLFAADISGQIYKLDEGLKFSSIIDKDILKASRIRESFDFEVDSLFNFYLGTGLAYYNVKTRSFSYLKSQKDSYGSTKTLQKISKNRLLVGTHSKVRILDMSNKEVSDTLKNNKLAKWCNALFEDKDNVVWLGTTGGLFTILNDSIVPYKNHQNKLLKKRILSINQFHDGSLLIGSKGEGLIVISGDRIYNVTEKDGLIGNMVQSVFVHRDSSIWIGTNKGVSKIECNGSLHQKEMNIINFTTQKGLPSNMVNDIKAYDGKIWFATSDGLSYIKEDEFKTNTIPLRVYIENLNIEDAIIPFSNDTLELDYFENNIRFNYLAICARCRQNVIYKYRLKNFKEDWTYTSNRNVQYTSLEAGTYTFQLSAANEDNVWNEVLVEKTFIIKPHFTKTLWFKVMMILFALFFLTFLFYAFFRRQRNKAQLDLKLVKLEQQALRTSMNPHFVFNALNSIQDFINKNDMLEANEYLVKFSHLIRANLEITKSNEVVLKDELDRLELYLSIEKLRFQNKLNYSISVDKSLDAKKVLVPVMILQPIVENAIVHGILPKENGGKVQISCSKINERQYRVLISDDGVGINVNTVHPNQSHKSLSTEFTKTRLDLLSRSTLKPYSVNITNLSDISDKSGIQVEFTLPI